MKLHDNQKERISALLEKYIGKGGRAREGVKEGSMKFKLMLGR